MYPDLFSRRYNLRPTSEGLIINDIPKSARIGVCYIAEEFFPDLKIWEFYQQICTALRIPLEIRDRNYQLDNDGIRSEIQQVIMECDWWRVFDICEIIVRNLTLTAYRETQFTDKINSLFVDEQLGYEMKKGKIEKVGSGFLESQRKQARYLLKEPEFKGADTQFEKAIRALNSRPNPDVENCIKDAVSAIESVAKIINKDEKASLSDIIKEMAKKGVIPKPLDENIQKLYAYRGNEPGVAHALVGESKVTIHEAEYVLAMSAATIIYLVNKTKSG